MVYIMLIILIFCFWILYILITNFYFCDTNYISLNFYYGFLGKKLIPSKNEFLEIVWIFIPMLIITFLYLLMYQLLSLQNYCLSSKIWNFENYIRLLGVDNYPQLEANSYYSFFITSYDLINSWAASLAGIKVDVYPGIISNFQKCFLNIQNFIMDNIANCLVFYMVLLLIQLKMDD